MGECSAEFFGTMILILFGCGVVAQVVTGGKELGTVPGSTGDYNSVAWGWGLGVMPVSYTHLTLPTILRV